MRRLALLGLLACGHGPASYEVAVPLCHASGTNITWRQIAATQGSAVLATSPPGDPRQFIVEQEGRIRTLLDGRYQPLDQPFLDISEDSNGPVVCCGEQGLLGLAFHPQFATNRTFFVFYTTADANVLARYQVKADDPEHADLSSGQVILSIPDFATNHNGGMIEFGTDGLLYIGTGDGGGGGDPHLNGQNQQALLGKILRIDVDQPPYAIPPGNPFGNEVLVTGARNPWRWSFDRATGDMWIGDVGQDTIEELDVLPAASLAGTNLGWSMFEGNDCFHAPCDTTAKTPPKFFKTHVEGWCSIIGGDVYRGACFPDLAGTYFFTDYCAHPLEEAHLKADGSLDVTEVASSAIALDGSTSQGVPQGPSSLHSDSAGEMFLTTTQGGVWHLEAGP